MTIYRTALVGALAALSLTVKATPDTSATLQIDIRSLLNARIVTTLTDGKLVPWTDALDAAGSGEATHAAAIRMGDPDPKALPDDGVFQATDRHPRVMLNFNNAWGTGNQVRRSVGEDRYRIAVPPMFYRQLWLFCMSGCGETRLTVQLRYTDGSAERKTLVVPDWYFPASDNDPRLCNLASDLGKWDDGNRMMEKDHHYLVGLDLAPDEHRQLKEVRLAKSAPGVLTLWGVTGVTP